MDDRRKDSSTFHGRDIFSPAARIWRLAKTGPVAGSEVSDLVRLSPRVATVGEMGISGEVIGLDDPFGSLITDVTGAILRNWDTRSATSHTANGKKAVHASLREYLHGRVRRFCLCYISTRVAGLAWP